MAVKYYCDRCTKQMNSKDYGKYVINATVKYRQNSYNLCEKCSKYIIKCLQEVDE